MAHLLQGVYAPLPQSLSDSDSEKEISMEPVCSTNYRNNNSKSTKDNCSYRQNGHLSFNSNVDDDILKVKRVTPRMSSLRKMALIFSILLCFLPIVIFLWVLPCSDSNTCPVKISNWEYHQDSIELNGNINLVHGAFQNNLNLALMYRGSLNSKRSRKNGIISFTGSSGAVTWNSQQESLPLQMNCSIIDVDGNGFNDCLVVDEMGLKAIETVSGGTFWLAHSAEEKSIPELDMPVKLPDLNGDKVGELLSIYKRESFLLISGKTGIALSNIKTLPLCVTIANLSTVDTNVRYGCRDFQKLIKTYELSITDIIRKFENALLNLTPTEVVPNSDETIFYETGKRKLKVENYDVCPQCRSNVSFYNGNLKLREWLYYNAFVMTPVPFSFESTKANIISLKGHVNGFILKIWEWRDHPKKLKSTTKVHKRSIPVNNQSYYSNEISERVVLITFNETDTHIVNTSLTDVIQICNEADICQPDHKNQKDSMQIADMDFDDSQELITYFSTYVKKEEEGDDSWHLLSYLKVFRLENELSKVYGSK